MRAIVMSEYGGPDCLRPAEHLDPVPEEGWAIVRLKAAALNWHDVLVREGRYGSRLLCWG
jgi:zinc-binding alcohol dehydrogenase/oxidoreductase